MMKFKFLTNMFDKNVVCIGSIGALTALSVLTEPLTAYPIISPLFSLGASSVLAYYGWSTINSLLDSSNYYFNKIFLESSDSEKVSLIHDFGIERHYSIPTEFLVKSSVGAAVFVNSVKTILCTDEKAGVAADVITPVALSVALSGVTFFSNRLGRLRDRESRILFSNNDEKNSVPVENSIKLSHTEVSLVPSEFGENSLMDIEAAYQKGV